MNYTLGLKNLPFEQNTKDILYVESRYDVEVNQYIQKHYNDIQHHFEINGFNFIYIPQMFNMSTEEFRYFVPYWKDTKAINADSGTILDYMVHPENRENIQPSLLFYHPDLIDKDYNDATCQYFGIRLRDFDYDKTDDLSNPLSYIISITSPKTENGGDIFFSIGREEGDIRFRKSQNITADDSFELESQQLLEEVRKRIRKLLSYGVNVSILEALIHEEKKLSRLVVTKNYDIILPDYENMKIEMRPLPKAVFLLFLRHPEGIVFKHLPDYHQELKEIYTKLKGGIMTRLFSKSIDDVTDPFNNSINEKCARIREAFISHFDEHLAKYYYVNGKRGEAKKILLPRELVTWE